MLISIEPRCFSIHPYKNTGVQLLSACPKSLVDIKNAIEHAIPPNGGTYLEESLSSFFVKIWQKVKKNLAVEIYGCVVHKVLTDP